MDLRDLLRSLDFERLAATARFPTIGEGMERLYFLEADGRLQPLRFRPFLFTLRGDLAVVPHGHHNMATMHLVLAGRARVRHFDRLETTDSHMLIRATSDSLAALGDVSSISDQVNNIHWFQGLSEHVFMFNIGVYQVNSTSPYGERDYVDPLGAESVGNGTLSAARMGRARRTRSTVAPDPSPHPKRYSGLRRLRTRVSSTLGRRNARSDTVSGSFGYRNSSSHAAFVSLGGRTGVARSHG
jgi:hypothetical protein